jgi:hypothetical protein|tara:strand:- start:410 stop:565 length:156 start_codon:yes stop_codon:yes gene_type:complete
MPANEYYKTKSEFHFNQYNAALDANKEKAATYHMNEHLNYEKLRGLNNDKV